jgi:hypothetical protein
MHNVATLRELDIDQLDEVGGGGSTEWSVSTGTAVALTLGAATVTSPIVATALVVGGIISAGFAIYYAIAGDEELTSS